MNQAMTYLCRDLRSSINKHNNQPGIQDHQQQNIKVVAVHLLVQEDPRILRYHREPITIDRSVKSFWRDIKDQHYGRMHQDEIYSTGDMTTKIFSDDIFLCIFSLQHRTDRYNIHKIRS